MKPSPLLKSEQQPPESQDTSIKKVSEIVKRCVYKKSAEQPHTSVLSFSHFRRRLELRVSFSTPAILFVGHDSSEVTLKDLSLSGMRLQADAPIEDLEGVEQVRVAIPILDEEVRLETHHWVYQVIRHFPDKGHYTVLLKRLDGSDEELKVLQDWVEQMAAKQVEMTDEVLTLSALLYEKIYTQSLLDILYIVEENDGESSIPVVFKPYVSSVSFDIFSVEGHYDLSTFTARDRVEVMRVDGNHRDENLYLVMYRNEDEAKIHSAMSHQFDNNEQWQQFLSYASDFTFMRIFEVIRAPLVAMAQEKLALRMAPILKKSTILGKKLQDEMANKVSVGLLVDTSELYRLPERRHHLHPKPEVEELGEDPHPLPELISFGVTPERKEPRYKVKMPLQINLRGHILDATTVDVSPSGMALQVGTVVRGIEPDEQVLISFVSQFTKKVFSKSVWEEVGYRVIRAIHKNGTLIFVRLDPNKQWRKIPSMLLRLLQKSAGDDAIDLRDEVMISRSNYMQSLVAENSPVIPFFFRTRGEGIALDLVAKTNATTNNRIWNFFETEAEYDFAPLFTPKRVGHMRREVRLAVTKMSTMVVYLFRTKSGTVFSASALELSQIKKYADTFFKLMHEHEYLVIKLVAGTAYHPTVDEISDLAAELGKISGKEIKTVRARVSRVVISGYLIDITDSYRSLLG